MDEFDLCLGYLANLSLLYLYKCTSTKRLKELFSVTDERLSVTTRLFSYNKTSANRNNSQW